MDSRMIAYCGLACVECPAFAATQADDRDALERVAAEWRVAFDAPNITAEWVRCDGCLGEAGSKCGHCAECEIRSCATGLGLANCAFCDSYTCEKLEGFFELAPEARANLDGIRFALVA